VADSAGLSKDNIHEKASIEDFTMLLDKLAEYYSIGFGKLNDLNAHDN